MKKFFIPMLFVFVAGLLFAGCPPSKTEQHVTPGGANRRSSRSTTPA